MRQFDGIAAYDDFGTLGSFGSSMGSGITLAMWIAVPDPGFAYCWGTVNDGNTTILQAAVNSSKAEVFEANGLYLFMRDQGASILRGNIISATLHDGNPHHLVATHDGPNDVFTAYVDGVNVGAFDYQTQGTPNNFANFAYNFTLGARNVRDTIGGYAELDVCDFQMFTGLANQGDVYALMRHNPRVPYQGLTKCWLSAPLRMGMGLRDYSREENDGTAVGSLVIPDPYQAVGPPSLLPIYAGAAFSTAGAPPAGNPWYYYAQAG